MDAGGLILGPERTSITTGIHMAREYEAALWTHYEQAVLGFLKQHHSGCQTQTGVHVLTIHSSKTSVAAIICGSDGHAIVQ